MIKRLRFDGSPLDVEGAPPDARPVRATVARVLPELTGPDAPHDVMAAEWFTDEAHLARFESWTDHAAGDVVAQECVVRGADWLQRRWRDGGARFQHVALARRADGLTPEAFAERWRAHAGRAGGTVIPDAARGQAYVQDHPCRSSAYDAVSEVWFDSVDGLQARIDWFRENRVGDEPDDLFSRSWFLAVREEVVLCSPTSS